MTQPDVQTDFDLFWESYPRKEAKKDARLAWGKLAPTVETQQAIHDALTWQIRSDGWRRGYIPLAATYLRGERWTDQPPQTSRTNGNGRVSIEDQDHVRQVQARKDADRPLNVAELAAAYYRTHPWVKR